MPAGDQLLTAVGGHGVNAGKISDQRVGMVTDRAVLAAHRDPGEVADMLVCACKLVEEGGLAAVLVADEGKCEQSIIGKRIPVSGLMKASRLTETGVFASAPGRAVTAVFGLAGVRSIFIGDRGGRERRYVVFDRQTAAVRVRAGSSSPAMRAVNRDDLDLLGISDTDGEFISVNAQFHGIAQGGELDDSHFGAGDDAHVKKVLTQRALTTDFCDDRGSPDRDPVQIDCLVTGLTGLN